MKYIVMEIQKNYDGTVALLPPLVKDTMLEAESAYHGILAAAALSDLAFHSAVILNDEGGFVNGCGFPHDPPEEEPEETAGETA